MLTLDDDGRAIETAAFDEKDRRAGETFWRRVSIAESAVTSDRVRRDSEVSALSLQKAMESGGGSVLSVEGADEGKKRRKKKVVNMNPRTLDDCCDRTLEFAFGGFSRKSPVRLKVSRKHTTSIRRDAAHAGTLDRCSKEVLAGALGNDELERVLGDMMW